MALLGAIKFAILSVFLAPVRSIAQKTEKKNFQVSTTLTSYYYYTPRLEFGFRKGLSDKMFYGLKLGYGNDIIISGKRSPIFLGHEYMSWSIRPFISYLVKSDDLKKSYLSFEVFYIYHQDFFHNESDYAKERMRLSRVVPQMLLEYDSATYQRKKYGFNVKYGLQLEFSNRLGLDINSGLGVRVRDVKYSNVFNPVQIEPPVDSLLPSTGHRNYIKEVGKNVRMNFVFDIELYYNIK